MGIFDWDLEAIRQLSDEKKDEWLRKYRARLKEWDLGYVENKKKLDLEYEMERKKITGRITALETVPRMTAKQKAKEAKKAMHEQGGFKTVEKK